jgi:myo-inositol-1(or 4)-monophosphatase
MGEAEHDLAAGALIAWEAGARIARVGGARPSLAEFVAETPVSVPTVVAAPRRLESIMAEIRLLD